MVLNDFVHHFRCPRQRIRPFVALGLFFNALRLSFSAAFARSRMVPSVAVMLHASHVAQSSPEFHAPHPEASFSFPVICMWFHSVATIIWHPVW